MVAQHKAFKGLDIQGYKEITKEKKGKKSGGGGRGATYRGLYGDTKTEIHKVCAVSRKGMKQETGRGKLDSPIHPSGEKEGRTGYCPSCKRLWGVTGEGKRGANFLFAWAYYRKSDEKGKERKKKDGGGTAGRRMWSQRSNEKKKSTGARFGRHARWGRGGRLVLQQLSTSSATFLESSSLAGNGGGKRRTHFDTRRAPQNSFFFSSAARRERVKKKKKKESTSNSTPPQRGKGDPQKEKEAIHKIPCPAEWPKRGEKKNRGG